MVLPLLVVGVGVVAASNSSEVRIGGLPGIWWSPVEHGVAGWPSLLAAGLSSLAIGAAVATRSVRLRHNNYICFLR